MYLEVTHLDYYRGGKGQLEFDMLRYVSAKEDGFRKYYSTIDQVQAFHLIIEKVTVHYKYTQYHCYKYDRNMNKKFFFRIVKFCPDKKYKDYIGGNPHITYPTQNCYNFHINF